MLQLHGIRFKICTFSKLVISSAAYFHLGETSNILHCVDVISSSIIEFSLFITVCFIKYTMIVFVEVQVVIFDHPVYMPSMVGETS
jgi:hypothetical protein